MYIIIILRMIIINKGIRMVRMIMKLFLIFGFIIFRFFVLFILELLAFLVYGSLNIKFLIVGWIFLAVSK